MVNYKFPFNDRIDIGGYVRILKPTDKIKILVSPDGATTESLHDTLTGANYQVPSNKELLIFHIAIWVNFNASAYVGSTSDLDGVADLTKLMNGWVGAGGIIPFSIPAFPNVPSSYYVTVTKVLSGDDVLIYGMEMDK